jgi:two-component system, OmpR family, osmolarity sensor histidine kinase EnvZ
MVVVRPSAFRRLIDNIVSNAVRYGGGHVSIHAERREGWTTIIVDDNGPGIPGAEREAVFRAFYRRDEARNQDTPGTGLGLSVARDVARSHGGEISLDVSPEGGLRVVVRLPG